jgi:hypothetical protein
VTLATLRGHQITSAVREQNGEEWR